MTNWRPYHIQPNATSILIYFSTRFIKATTYFTHSELNQFYLKGNKCQQYSTNYLIFWKKQSLQKKSFWTVQTLQKRMKDSLFYTVFFVLNCICFCKFWNIRFKILVTIIRETFSVLQVLTNFIKNVWIRLSSFNHK